MKIKYTAFLQHSPVTPSDRTLGSIMPVFQGKQSVDTYVDEFEDLIELSGYTDKLNTIVKFRCGLQPAIQDKIAEMGKDRPDDDDADGWYRTMRMFDQNRRANEAFHSSTT
jgi:hypothetical protein